MTQGRKLKKRPPQAISKTQADRLRAEGIFKKALDGSRWGKTPGMVDLKIQVSVYVPALQREEKLPGEKIDVSISSIEEVREMMERARKAIADWMAGL
jgi:hypothetical protein